MYGYRKVTYSKENCLNTVSKQCNVISMGLSKQKSSPIDQLQKVPGNKYCLEYCVSKQRNAISMGLSKQKSSPIDSYKKVQPGSKYYCLNTVETVQCYFNGIVETEIQSY